MTFTKVTIFLQELLHQIHYSRSLNLSGNEIIFLAVLGLAVWIAGRKRPRILSGYCIFLILYITLLRRAPGYDESVRWSLRFWPRAGIWAGNLLNILLYIPLGWTAARTQRRRNWFQLLMLGAALSVFCECVQYLTGRGCADVNDVIWNVVGMSVGYLGTRQITLKH